jgi:hypothetical protein
MFVWLITGSAAVLAAAVIAGAYQVVLRRHRRMAIPIPAQNDPDICFYLDDEIVMNLFHQRENTALRQEVEEQSRSSKDGKITAQVQGVGAQAGKTDEQTRVIKYITDQSPITVIRKIIADLERADKIVYVDLLNRSIEPSTGLERAFQQGRSPVSGSARLRDLKPFIYVSILGRFRVTDKTDRTTTFSAPYGDPDDPASEPKQVSVTCVTDQLRREDVPTGSFPARCLGRIQGWDPDTRKLVIDPVLAIFR